MIKLSLYLILGIVLGHYFTIPVRLILISSLSFLIILFLIMQLLKLRFEYQSWLGLLIYITTISSGILTSRLHDQSNFSNHYINYAPSDTDSPVELTFRITEVLKSGKYHDKYMVKVLEIEHQKAKGRLLLNIEKDSLNDKLEVDAVFFTLTSLKKINTPLNPHQFDYNAYMRKKYISHQLLVNNSSISKINVSQPTIVGYAALMRRKIQKSLGSYTFKTDELSIINALLLGQRQDISKEIYDNYTKAGAIHILAVSGLHIGIILLLLQRFLKFLDIIKSGKIIRVALILLLLWSYAVVAGLSASVVRAVTMFTVFAIAMNLKRPTNVYNTIAVSIFILLLFKPNFLFDIGFQLSYLAVLSIVTIEPMLNSLWHPKAKIVNFYWRILTVTFSAQIGVVPISLYYFHQFPGLFFLSNLVIIPFLGTILGFGILIIVLSLFNLLPLWMASIYGSIISIMNNFVKWISDQEAIVFQNLSFGISQVVFSYSLIILLLIVLKKRSNRSIIAILFAILCFQCYFILDKKRSSDQAFIIFHKSRYSIFGMKHNKQLIVHHNLELENLMSEKLISNYKVGEHLNIIKFDSIADYYMFGQHNMLVVDSSGVYNVHLLKPNIVLLRNSPKINLIRLIDSIKPELIICDGSNYTSYQERWSRTCEVKKIPFHQTRKKGAFIYRY